MLFDNLQSLWIVNRIENDYYSKFAYIFNFENFYVNKKKIAITIVSIRLRIILLKILKCKLLFATLQQRIIDIYIIFFKYKLYANMRNLKQEKCTYIHLCTGRIIHDLNNNNVQTDNTNNNNNKKRTFINGSNKQEERQQ